VRTIGLVTVGRSDYGIYLPILKLITADSSFCLRLYASGMHLSDEFGRTVTLIEADGFKVAERIEMLVSSDTPGGVAKSIGLGIIGFGQSFCRERPDVLVVLGDRFEMYAAAVAALPFQIPLVHIHGGELTYGAIDDALRHGITKLSHLHFVSTQEYARRVEQLGEEPWRITVSGAPGLDNLNAIKMMSRSQLESALGFALEKQFLIVTYHPVTTQYNKAALQCKELLKSIAALRMQAVFTMPNADTSGRVVAELIQDFIQSHAGSHLVHNLGTQLYFNLMRHASAMVGNSSSGLIEAPSFGLPVVNIGIRQAGRIRGSNVIDVEDGHIPILKGVQKALTREFLNIARQKANPYMANKGAARTIVDRLKAVPLDERLLNKRFKDWAHP
jgi:UDP-hydrolysing UDP-N-acetyl-D-glucosamine 2-epimerase